MKRNRATKKSSMRAKKDRKEKNELEEQVSVFGSLPDDVLLELFERITSLPDRFSLAGVNRKFRKLMLRELRKPMPLHLNLTSVWLLNGHKIARKNWPVAMEVLAEKTQFTEIVHSGFRFVQNPIGDRFYGALLSSPSSLEKVTKFVCEVWCKSDWWQKRIVSLIRNIPKLSDLNLDLGYFSFSKLQLPAALENKPLTEVSLSIQSNPKEFVQLFEALQPNTLRKLTILVGCDRERWQNEFRAVFETLRKKAWSELETINFGFQGVWESVPASDVFFTELQLLPKLTKCSFTLDYNTTQQELAHCIVLYLKSAAASPHDRTFESRLCLDLAEQSGCWIGDVLLRVQTAIPGVGLSLEIEHMDEDEVVTVSYSLQLQNAVFKVAGLVFAQMCHCHTCNGFYPIFLINLWSQAKHMTSGHLEGYRLDKCKIGRLVNDLNAADGAPPLALSAVANHNSTVNVSFEYGNDVFVITVHTDNCFDGACIGCALE